MTRPMSKLSGCRSSRRSRSAHSKIYEANGTTNPGAFKKVDAFFDVIRTRKRGLFAEKAPPARAVKYFPISRDQRHHE